MNNMPKKLREQMSNDPFYSKCCNGKDCKGRVTWEHALYFSGRQIQEWWAIIPLCEYHHGVSVYQSAYGLDKKWNQWVALNRLFSSFAIVEAEKKYSKAIYHWKSQLLFLNRKYGKYNIKKNQGILYR